MVLKGTHGGVDGIYTADPEVDAGATRLERITYLDVLNKGLEVMDSTAITLCMDNGLPIVVFNLMEPGNLQSLLDGAQVGTLVAQEERGA